jgi:hypothetical protein
MDALTAMLGLVAGMLAVVASALPLYMAYKECKSKRLNNDDSTSGDTDKSGKTESVVGSKPEV